MQELLDSFRSIVGDDYVLEGDDVSTRISGVWREDGIAARAIVCPRTTEEVSATMKLCFDANQRVVAHGGLTGLVGGAVTQPDDIVVSLERMTDIESLDPLNRTMTVQAGATLQTIQEAAEEENMLYPMDLGARGSCTIGGNIATNAGGNHVIRYGMTRDSVLGTEVVLADGTVVSSMNEMIKNNAGYDLKHLFIGTEGSLGIVTRAVLRLRELPQRHETAFVAVSEFEKLPELLKLLDSTLCGTLCAYEVMWQDFYKTVSTPPANQSPPISQEYPFYVLVESMGSSRDDASGQLEAALEEAFESELIVDAAIAQSEAQRKAFWALRDDVDTCMQKKPAFVFDVSLQIPNMKKYVDEVDVELSKHFDDYRLLTFGHMGDGNLHFCISAGKDESAHGTVDRCVYEPLRQINGSISAEHGIGHEKKVYLDISRNEDELNLMRSLKQALDPKGILNPGIIF